MIHWPSGTTSGSNSSLGLFYSIYLGPEIKNLEEPPYYGWEIFSLYLWADFCHFVLHIKSRHQGLEVKQPFNLYWWAELNFGQEPIFFKHPYFIFYPWSCFLTTKLTLNLLSAASSVWELEQWILNESLILSRW